MSKMIVGLAVMVLLLSVTFLSAAPQNSRLTNFHSVNEILRGMGGQNRELSVTEIVGQYGQWMGYENVEWSNDTRRVFSYDMYQRIGSFLEYYWDWDEEAWFEDFSRGVINWNADGTLGGISIQFYDEYDEEWFDFLRYVQTYNDFLNIEQVSMQMGGGNGYEPFIVWELFFSYDDQDQIDEILHVSSEDFRKRNNRDYSYEKTQITYDANGRFSLLLTEWSYDAEVWYPYETTMVDYHPMDYSHYQDFQDMYNNFALMMSGTFIPGVFNNILFASYESHYWDDMDNDWVPDYRDLYEYSGNQLTYLVYYYWNYDHWETMDREYYIYNAEGYLTEIRYQWEHYEEWLDEYRDLYYYGDPASVEEPEILSPITAIKNYPNPFNPETTISFNLFSQQKIELSVYNILGQKVKTLINDTKGAGGHSVVWNGVDDSGRDVPSGIYFYRLNSKESVVRGKMLLLK